MSQVKKSKRIKVDLKYLQLCQNYWSLSTSIRRGLKNKETNRFRKLNSQEMNERINHYLLHFNWPKYLLDQIGQLQEIAKKKLLEEQGNVQSENQTDGGPLRSASESA